VDGTNGPGFFEFRFTTESATAGGVLGRDSGAVAPALLPAAPFRLPELFMPPRLLIDPPICALAVPARTKIPISNIAFLICSPLQPRADSRPRALISPYRLTEHIFLKMVQKYRRYQGPSVGSWTHLKQSSRSGSPGAIDPRPSTRIAYLQSHFHSALCPKPAPQLQSSSCHSAENDRHTPPQHAFGPP
jgi:hypothetical protein